MRLLLTNPIWELLEPMVENAKHSKAGAKPEISERLFLEAILYLARTGVPWRDLPEEFGKWNSLYQRFKRWRISGVFERLFAELPREAALDEVRRLFIDSTIVRAHAHAAGAQKKSVRTKKRWEEVGAGMGPKSI